MAKYSQEFKLKVVQYYLSGFGSKTTGHKFNINPSSVEEGVKSYNQHGETGLDTLRTKPVFSIEFKYKVVKIALDEGLSIRETAQRFNIKEKETVRRWLFLYQKDGIDGLKPKPKGPLKGMSTPKLIKSKYAQEDRDKTQDQLLEELAYLRAENAYLKKRRALIQKQKEQEKAELQRLQDSCLN